MSRTNFLHLSLILLIVIGVAFLMFACNGVTPIIDIAIGGDGTMYAGAVLPVQAIISNLTVSGEKIDFAIVQEEEYAYFDSEGKLAIRETAPTGATIDITVTVEGYIFTKTFTIQKTPVDSIELLPIPPMKAGDSHTLQANFYPERSSENGVTYEIVEGSEIASIVSGVITISAVAKSSDQVIVVAKSNDKTSEGVNITITTVFAESLILIAPSNLYSGESIDLIYNIQPNDTNVGVVVFTIEEGEEVASIVDNTLTISETAAIGSTIKYYAQIGDIKSNTITRTIVKKPVDEVNLFIKYFEDSDVKIGDSRELYAEISPLNATVNTWSLIILEGEDFVNYDSDTNRFTVIAGSEGDIIRVKATADGQESDIITFTIVKIPVQIVTIIVDDGHTVAVAPGEARSLTVEVLPNNATYPDYELHIEQGEEYIDRDGGEYTFKDAPEGTQVKLRAYADGVYSEYLVFTIVPIPVESVLISTDDPITELRGADIVIFEGSVAPSNATRKELTYYIVSGEEYGSITQNGVFTAAIDAIRGTVIVQAVSADGVESNVIIIEILGTFYTYKPNNWAEIDNRASIFNGQHALWLDLKTMPLDANNTTIIFSQDIKQLVIEGGYAGTVASGIANLNMYFLTSSALYVTFKDLGIVITERFGGTVIDFNTQGSITLNIEGNCYIEAGSAYSPYTTGFTVDGEWSTAPTNYIRKHGMDGFGGYDGGTAISANNLTIVGEGNLTVKAGSGSSGTDGGRGADTPIGVADQIAGNGGRGGYGGDSGFAIFANNITLNFSGSIYAYGGNAGKGGLGGVRGVGSGVDFNGLKGVDGSDGIMHNPVYAYNSYSWVAGVVNNMYIGEVVDDSETRPDNYIEFAQKLERYYKIDLHYGTDFWNPYAPTLFSWRGKYRMTQQNNPVEILKLLHALEGALRVFPKNMYIELRIVNTEVNIYLVNTITNSSGGVVYGLTSNVNNMWFATFDTRLRDTFYSTYYNIMIHEILHLLTFSMGSTSSNPMRTGLPQYNLGLSYTTNAQGVYDPEKGYGATNSAFLTRYSKTDFNEDISDNLSIICMLVFKADFMNNGTPINLKSRYIANTYRNFYMTFAYYMPTPWERLIWDY